MAIDDLIKDIKKHNIQEIIRVHEYNDRLTGDQRTGFVKGFEPKFDYHTNFNNNIETKIDPRTNFGKGISFKSVDGKELASYEYAMAYNQWYYESKIMPIKDKKGMHR